ncbi:methyl-accepting chemotaxis protein [Actimicrobium sp. CCI2.3]|uniref:methyl-accepting chemotaxis protein n=1 Tax=Actimicrobium sp. CCI2.3 TaxID=3048616 RepID=UPI002AB39443|nr:methyl-accepting chemotaxis protein [Actimicrobium sp. CCI2.3]MDY7575403.1 methyl-accepting chemotaxis protein [Actimicrobium sp. CCI2.3]MEB0021314.1 methyl-accepting chemotaxis protein [Actimicrobium sp. CCI2.3]
MRIHTKLIISFAVLTGMVLLVAAIALNSISKANDHFSQYIHGIKARGAEADKFRRAVDERAIAVRNLVLVTKPADLALETELVKAAHARAGEHFAKLKDMLAKATDVSEKGRLMVVEMEKLETKYAPVALAIVDLALKKKTQEAIAMMNDECRPLLASIVKLSTEYAEVTEARSIQIIEESQANYIVRQNLLIAVCLLGICFAAVTGVLVTRSITRPINKAVQLADAVAKGDLTMQIDIEGKDETARLLASLKTMQESLSQVVAGVRQNAEGVATGSEQIAQGNADLSQRTEEQASALEETASSMEELGSTVRQNAENAKRASQFALGASAVACEGGKVVNQVVETMKGINDSSRRIADIISVIDGIAFQTNILALNAAVEAARAGEQGRGFAVVASEVRSLAQRSAEAAKEIKSLIGTSVERVVEGTMLVDKAGATMTEIVDSIKRVTDIMTEISVASVEQSTGVGQVSEAVSQMDQATQQNAAMVEQSAAAAENLKDQASALVQSVAVFKLTMQQGVNNSTAPAPERRSPNRARNVIRPAFKLVNTPTRKTIAAAAPPLSSLS